ncbi:28S ribosomal protein S5, mitochondrial [Vermiconidia calcicola]|uniref:28S ribosomal protein S5, mitochondrial n=1 Tax=Vermiconidia calcicola TaxID=1690605 RepID=A0ACC3NQA6_9PEZI|nr:28S ribosomal protein S5, mitochondrial [Vermiconidia calcicola]
MSTPKPYQCLSCRLKQSIIWPSTKSSTRRQFHASTPSKAHKRGYPSIKASDLEQPQFRAYTPHEKKLLALKYTPEQMKVIEAGERAVSAEDLARQGRMRTDPMRIKYLDDFATMRPMLDRAVTEQDLQAAEEGEGLVEGANRSARDSKKKDNQQQPTEEIDPHMLRLSQQTGMTIQEIKRIRVKNLVMHRVVNQTRMGKIQSLYYLTIAGNQDGMVGIGEGKAAEDEDGRRQAMMNAIRNMKPIPRYEERTIYGSVEGKVGAAVVQLSSRPPGFGNRCQHLIFELARAAGISDLAARTPRSRNKMNVVKAAFKALTAQRLPEDVARGRGRKMVDARSVYYGGQAMPYLRPALGVLATVEVGKFVLLWHMTGLQEKQIAINAKQIAINKAETENLLELQKRQNQDIIARQDRTYRQRERHHRES